ncbi:MAG: DUF4160 domain-containing protein [Propionibacteriaceae bacterium]|nr:DUF4160 domain-containing protein [Propionibacteriaceae bacterium]
MPELSRFFNIVVRMFYSDQSEHNKPHVHVEYNEFRAVVGLDGELLAGHLPTKQWRLLLGWITLHEEELYIAWNQAVRNEPFGKVAPLN